MCIRDRDKRIIDDVITEFNLEGFVNRPIYQLSDGEMQKVCLLYTSDAADERSSVDLGGRRIIKKKNKQNIKGTQSLRNKNTQHEAHSINIEQRVK